MEGLILHTQNSGDISLIIQLAERLGISYGYAQKERAKSPKHAEISEIIAKLVRPIGKTIDIEALKSARKYKGVNRKRFDRLVKEIDIPQTAEELIAQL